MNRVFELFFSMLDPIKCAKKKGVKVGSECRFINYPDFGTEPYLISLGNRVEISKDVRFITHDGATWTFRNQKRYEQVIRFGRIDVGDNTFIGTRSTILPNIKIGKDCIVGACSLVSRNIPDGQVWAGCPARYICDTRDFAEKCLKETPEYNRDVFLSRKGKQNEVERTTKKAGESKQQ